MANKRILVLSLVLALLAMLASCGGSKAKPPAPTLNLDYQAVKVFNFSWVDVEGETGYKLFEDEDGSGDFVEIASIPANAGSYQLEVFLPDKVNARYKLAACNESGCSESAEVEVAVDQLVRAIGYFKASNTDAWDEFGKSIALSADGSTLAVGASSESSSATGINGDQSDNSADSSGAVYVFVRDGANWSQQAYIKASNTDMYDHFGHSIALSADGNTLAVGAYREDSSATGIGGDQSDNSADGSGAVYVFVRDGGSWSQQAYVKASNTEQGDWFGESVSLSADGNTLAVGAFWEDSNATGIDGDQSDNSARNSGAVYVFTRNAAGSWTQQAYVKASNTGEGDEFGNALSLSADGNTLAVGASLEDSNATGIDGDQSDNSAIDSGAVYVFTRNAAGSWTQQAYVKASNTGASGFGDPVALSADGSTMAAGGSDASGGVAYVFTRSGSAWAQQAYIKPSNTEQGDWFGESVSLSADGNTLAVGAFWEDSNATGINGNQSDNSASDSGAAYVFTRNATGSWAQQAYIKASNTETRDGFGYSLALSGDGNTLAVGALHESSSATGIGGNQNDGSASDSGAVYVY